MTQGGKQRLWALGASHPPHSFHCTGQTISVPGHARPGSGHWGESQQDDSMEALPLQHIFSPAVYKLWLSYRELSWNALGVAFMNLNGKPEAQWKSG